jgi:hypothetical protein
VSALEALELAALLVLSAMLAITLLNLAGARRLHRSPAPATRRRVSVLVPARDEAENLRENLPALARSHDPHVEILVLDDGSVDGTAALVAEMATSESRIRLISGTPPPPGWLGKSWACDRLAREAAGEILIFCDADVRVGPHAVERSVSLMERTCCGLLTALPRQCTVGALESAVVPLVSQLPVLALLPLRAAERASSPSLTMGNGQWMAFTRESYARCGGHAAVRNTVLEDVALARAAKAAGEKVVVAFAPRDLEVRMYRSAAAVREGFRKNLYALCGGRPAALATVLAIAVLTLVLPLAAPLLGPLSLVSLAILVTIRLAGVVALGHPVTSVVLHPVGVVAAILLALDSAAAARRGAAMWKGRTLDEPRGPDPHPTIRTEAGWRRR